MANLQGLKLHAVVDGDLDDEVLQLCLDAAIEYLTGAGAVEPDSGSALFDMAAYRLATCYYEHRAPDGSVDTSYVPPGINGMILQLRYG